MTWITEPTTHNVIQLGLAFFCNFFAFNGQGFIEEAVVDSQKDKGKIDQHAGYNSLAIIYASFTICNFVAAPVVDTLRPKWAMIIGVLCYAIFQAGFLFLNEIYLYATSALLGFGAAILWTGQGTYLSQNCTEETTSRNSALLWGLGQTCLVGAGIFLYIVFHSSDTTDNIATSTVRILYGTFTGLAVVAAVILLFLRTPPYEKKKLDMSYASLLGSTFYLMFTKEMALLAIAFAYTGIEQSYWTGIYPTCISFTKKLGQHTNSYLALNSIAAGLGQMLAGLIFGILGDRTRKIGREKIVLLGAIVHLICFVLSYMNFPSDASLKKTDDTGHLWDPKLGVALTVGFLLGFGDGCWNTQIYSLLCDAFSHKSSEAFALFKFYQSGLSAAAFFYSSSLQLQWHLLILIISSVFATASFVIFEQLLLKPYKQKIARIEKREHGYSCESDQPPPYPISERI